MSDPGPVADPYGPIVANLVDQMRSALVGCLDGLDYAIVASELLGSFEFGGEIPPEGAEQFVVDKVLPALARMPQPEAIGLARLLSETGSASLRKAAGVVADELAAQGVADPGRPDPVTPARSWWIAADDDPGRSLLVEYNGNAGGLLVELDSAGEPRRLSLLDGAASVIAELLAADGVDVHDISASESAEILAAALAGPTSPEADPDDIADRRGLAILTADRLATPAPGG